MEIWDYEDFVSWRLRLSIYKQASYFYIPEYQFLCNGEKIGFFHMVDNEASTSSF